MIPTNFKYPQYILNELSSESGEADPKIFEKAIELGLKNRELIVEDVADWSRQKIEFEVDQEFVDFVNDSIKEDLTISEKIASLADVYRKFEEFTPQNEASDVLCHLLLNYVSARLELPIIIFKSGEKDELVQARDDVVKAGLYFAKKVKEIYTMGNHVYRYKEKSGQTYTYETADQKKSLNVEWHDIGRYERQLKRIQRAT